MDNNAAIAKRWFEEVWNQGREETIHELLAPDAVAHGLTDAADDHRGPAAFMPFWEQLRGAFPDMRFTVEETVSEGDMIAVRWSAAMTHGGDHLGVAATGKPVTITGMTFLRIEGGKLIEGWNNWDQLGMAREIGLLPQTPGKG